MSMNRYLVVLLLVFASLGATAAEREYRSVDEFLSSLAPDSWRQVVEGDLNGDNLSDRAIVSRAHGNNKVAKLYILLQTKNGSFYLAHESKTDDPDIRTATTLSINNGSLFVSLDGINPTHAARHQFKLYRGIWRMIGLTFTIVDSSDTGPDGGVLTIATDLNLLTGDIIIKHGTRTGEKTSRDKFTVTPCPLADYDFDVFFCARDWKTKNGIPVPALMGSN